MQLVTEFFEQRYNNSTLEDAASHRIFFRSFLSYEGLNDAIFLIFLFWRLKSFSNQEHFRQYFLLEMSLSRDQVIYSVDPTQFSTTILWFYQQN